MTDPNATAQSVDEWLVLAERHRGDARALLKEKRGPGAWQSTGLAVECVIKAAIMRRERMNRWPDRDQAPELHTHDPAKLLRRLGVTLVGMERSRYAAALKVVCGWQRAHGYQPKGLPLRFARDMYEAAFGSDGVVEWLATTYSLDV